MDTSQNGDNQNGDKSKTATNPKRRQTKTATNQNGDNQNGDMPKWRHIQNGDNQDGDNQNGACLSPFWRVTVLDTTKMATNPKRRQSNLSPFWLSSFWIVAILTGSPVPVHIDQSCIGISCKKCFNVWLSRQFYGNIITFNLIRGSIKIFVYMYLFCIPLNPS